MRRSKRMTRILREQWNLSGDALLREHGEPVKATLAPAVLFLSPMKLSADFKSLTMRMLLVSGIGGHRLLAYRAVGLMLLMLATAFVFWRLSKTEGKFLRIVAGVFVLLAVAQLPGVAAPIHECTRDTATWLWWLSGCWYL